MQTLGVTRWKETELSLVLRQGPSSHCLAVPGAAASDPLWDSREHHLPFSADSLRAYPPFISTLGSFSSILQALVQTYPPLFN